MAAVKVLHILQAYNTAAIDAKKLSREEIRTDDIHLFMVLYSSIPSRGYKVRVLSLQGTTSLKTSHDIVICLFVVVSKVRDDHVDTSNVWRAHRFDCQKSDTQKFRDEVAHPARNIPVFKVLKSIE